MTYIDVLRQELMGADHERIIILPTAIWGCGVPVQIGQGDLHAHYEPRRIIEVVRQAGMKSCVFAHSHPSFDPPRPSYGDLSDAADLQRVLKAFSIRLEDILIVSTPGEIFSFAYEGILTNPLREGRRFAEEAQRTVASRR
jgi:hypothetical protein